MHFFKTLDFDGFCENSALRRDWCSSAHLLEGLGPHVSDPGWLKWFPQAPFKATTQNSAYTVVIGARPAPLLPQNGFLLPRRRAHFVQRLFLLVFVIFGKPS